MSLFWDILASVLGAASASANTDPDNSGKQCLHADECYSVHCPTSSYSHVAAVFLPAPLGAVNEAPRQGSEANGGHFEE